MNQKRQPSWEPALSRFFEFVHNSTLFEVLSPGDSVIPANTRPFVPIDQVQAYFTRNKSAELKNIISSLFPPTDPCYPIYPKDILPKYTAVFCTLLLCGRGCYIEHFRHNDSLSDAAMPFDINNPPPHFPTATGDDNLLADFCETQWKFCPAVLDDSVSDKHYEEERILPITTRKRLAGGATANLWLITVHPSYNRLVTGDCKTSDGNGTSTFVLKEYSTLDARSYYDNEVAAFRKVGDSPNVIGYYASFVRGDTFNVVLEHADMGNLSDFFEIQAPPAQSEQIIKLWEKLFRLIDGLRAIHTIKPFLSDGPSIFQGWHQDVKPGNILVVSNGDRYNSGLQFKLADLGISHFNINCPSRASLASDTYGTRTYGAPECFRPDQASAKTKLRINQNIDIWSLGCIYSEAICWMAHGNYGVLEYREERKLETSTISAMGEIGGLDCFHDQEKALDAVHKSHKKSLEELRRKFPYNDAVIQMVISIIDMVESMLVDTTARPTAHQLWNKQLTIIERARQNQVACNSPVPPTPHSANNMTLTNCQRPPIDGPPILPPVLPPEYATLYGPQVITPNNDLTQNHKRNYSDISQGEQNDTFCQSPEMYAVENSLLQARPDPAPDLSRHNSPFSTPSPYTPYTPKTSAFGQFRNQSTPKCLVQEEHNQDDFIADELFHEDSDSATTTTTSAVPYGGGQEAKGSEIQTCPSAQPTFNSSSISALGLIYQQPVVPAPNVRVTPHSMNIIEPSSNSISEDHPPKRPSIRRNTTPDYLTLDEALDQKQKWNNKKTSRSWLNQDLLNRLNDRQFIFLIDDSFTMIEHWPNVCRVFEALSFMVGHIGDARLSLYFTISKKFVKDTKSSKDLLAIIEAMQDEVSSKDSTTDINVRLSQIMEDYKDKLDSRSWWRRKPKPLSLFILTDGIWEEQVTASEPIKSAVAKLEDLRKDKRQIGIQFIRFGNDLEGIEKLEHLDDRLDVPKDIVDTEPSHGNIWKMLLGPISEKYDSRMYTIG